MRKKKLKAKKIDDTIKSILSQGQYEKLREWNRKRRKERQLRKK